MSNINRTAFADAIKDVYEKKLLLVAASRFVHGVRATLATFKGGSYELRRYGALAAVTTSLSAEGVTPVEGSAPSLTKLTLTPLYYGNWIGHTDEIEVVQYDDTVMQSVKALGRQAGLSFDTILRNTMTDGATKLYANGQSASTDLDTTNDKATWSDFLRAYATLMGANAIEGGGYDVIMHPFSYAELMQDDDFVGLFQQESPSPMRTGYVGSILGCKIWVSSNARVHSGAGADTSTNVYDMLFIGEEAVGVAGYPGLLPNLQAGMGAGEYDNNTGKDVNAVDIIVKELGSAGTNDPLNQRGSIGWKATYDDEILNAAFMVSLEHCVTL